MGELGGNALSILPVAASTFETNRAAALLARASRSARVKYVVVFCESTRMSACSACMQESRHAHPDGVVLSWPSTSAGSRKKRSGRAPILTGFDGGVVGEGKQGKENTMHMLSRHMRLGSGLATGIR